MFAREIVIVTGSRTPIGCFRGALSTIPATKLGTIAIADAIKQANMEPADIEYVMMGQVLQAGCGQNPARQSSLKANIPVSTDCWTINKLCASGMKAIHCAAQSISVGMHDVIVAGGMESMSQAPHIVKLRNQTFNLGTVGLEDTLLADGLLDVYSGSHMGRCTEELAKESGITRVAQDEYAIESYRRTADAWNSGVMKNEVVAVRKTNPKAKIAEAGVEVVEQDEEFTKIKIEKVAQLKPAFMEDGTITAANASKLSDGAAAVIVASEEKASKMGITPRARIVSIADAANDPTYFGNAAGEALRKAVARSGLKMSQIDIFEINEAFAAVVLAQMQALSIEPDRVNIHGGAIAMGHPIGMSGTRVVLSLLNCLDAVQGRYGVAAICNGGGGGSAIVIERLSS